MRAYYLSIAWYLADLFGSFHGRFEYRIEQMYLSDLYLHFFAEYCANFRANTVI